jgi:hypothetical protein
MVTTFPFAGSLGWSAMLLAFTSKCFGAERWPTRLVWATVAAICWGQIAAMHPSFGLVLGSGIVAAYMVFKVVGSMFSNRATSVRSLLVCLLLGTSFAVVNAAIFLPRIALVPRTSIGLTYHEMRELGREMRMLPEGSLDPRETDPMLLAAGGDPIFQQWYWPFLEYPSGAYLGMAALALSGAGLWSRRHRLVAGALIAYCVACYSLALRSVAIALNGLLPTFVESLYQHHRTRFIYALLLAVPLLAGFGVEAWRRARSPLARITMLIPGVLVWLLPMLLSARPSGAAARLVLFGLIAGGVALAASSVRPALVFLVPIGIGVELTVNGVVGPALAEGTPPRPKVPLEAPESPSVIAAEYTRDGPIVDALRSSPHDGRFMSYAPGLLKTPAEFFRGYLLFREKPYWDLMANQRGLLFGLEDAQGHGPVQVLRYWKFLRAVTDRRIKYSTAIFLDPPPVAFDLLQVTSLVGSADEAPARRLRRVVTEGDWAVYEVPDPVERVSLVSSWTMVDSSEQALQAVVRPGFDASREMILEEDPGIPSSSGPAAGTVEYEERGTQGAEIQVRAESPALVLIRNVYDKNWTATLDGDPAKLLAADYLIQGIAVPPGRHTIVLRYVDPSIATGLIISFFGLSLLIGAAGVIHVRSRWARRYLSPARRKVIVPEDTADEGPT